MCKHTFSLARNVMDQKSGDGEIIIKSQSTEGKRFPDFEMLDSNIASTLRKIISNSNFIRRVCGEEQRAQKRCRFWGGRQIAYTFKQLELKMYLKAYQICSMFAYMMMTFRISIREVTKFCWQQARYLKRMSFKVCTR